MIVVIGVSLICGTGVAFDEIGVTGPETIGVFWRVARGVADEDEVSAESVIGDFVREVGSTFGDEVLLVSLLMPCSGEEVEVDCSKPANDELMVVDDGCEKTGEGSCKPPLTEDDSSSLVPIARRLIDCKLRAERYDQVNF